MWAPAVPEKHRRCPLARGQRKGRAMRKPSVGTTKCNVRWNPSEARSALMMRECKKANCSVSRPPKPHARKPIRQRYASCEMSCAQPTLSLPSAYPLMLSCLVASLRCCCLPSREGEDTDARPAPSVPPSETRTRLRPPTCGRLATPSLDQRAASQMCRGDRFYPPVYCRKARNRVPTFETGVLQK